MGATKKLTALTDAVLIVIFLAVIGLPPAVALLGTSDTGGGGEKRKLAPLPDFPRTLAALDRFPTSFEAFYDDHFGFRGSLIRYYNLLCMELFSRAGNDRVLKGKEDWLFYRARNVLDYHRRISPFTDEELHQWEKVLTERRDWLKERGIDYLIFFAPNKHTIYPEYLPDWIKTLNGPTRLDQLLDYLRARTDLDIIDLRPDMLAAKKKVRLYHKTDSHWNDWGAWYAYQRVMGHLAEKYPVLAPCPLSQTQWQTNWTKGRDLARMLELEDVLPEEVFDYRIEGKVPYREVTKGFYPSKIIKRNRMIATESDVPGLPRAVIFRDSFFRNLVRLFARHFSRCLYLSDYSFDPELLRREKPDIVIHEMLERELMNYVPENPEGLK